MPDSPVTLGSFTFEGLEVPDRVILRNRQKLIVHHMTSGARAIDTTGTDIQTIAFRGVFSGSAAPERIKYIESMRDGGNQLLFSWDFQIAEVYIQDFEILYQSHQWIPYRLTCQVTDPATPPSRTAADLLWAGSSSQISDIGNLLNNAGIGMPAGVTPALRELAALNYDAAPAPAMAKVTRFVSDISDRIVKTAHRPADSATPADAAAATGLLALIESCRLNANLILCRNRLNDIVVRSSNIGGV